jgi:DNA-binding protein HU-beta
MKKNFTRKDITSKVTKSTGISSTVVATVLDSILEEIKEALIDGNGIEFREFGTFLPTKRKARNYRIPRTGEKMKAPPTTTVKFKPSAKFLVKEDI